VRRSKIGGGYIHAGLSDVEPKIFVSQLKQLIQLRANGLRTRNRLGLS